jgi:serine/threonine-protein kinase
MARVFLGRDEILERPVAIKVLNPGHGATDIGARFRREGRTAARLSHPNIVQVFDAGEDEFEGREVSYIVMEYVPGGDLKGLIDERGPMPSDDLAKLGAEVAAGLAHAHASGVIHRDIKPHNILIDANGRPKLTDFGIARALDTTQATQTGSYLGTALYSSPEQLRGERVTPKSDIYSLGITFYQAAVGEAPFTGTPIEIASQHVSREPDVPSIHGAHLSGEVERLILDCVQKDPDLRPTAEEVRERLREETRPTRSSEAYAVPPIPDPSPVEPTTTASTGEPLAGSPPADRPGAAWREGGRRRAPILLAAAALLLVLLGVTTAYAMFGRDEADTALVPQEDNQQAGSEVTGEQGAGAAGEETTSGSAAPESTAAGGGESTATGGGSGDSPEEEAAQALEDYYTAAADGDYDRAWSFLSPDYRQQFRSEASYTSQFDTLESIDFEEGPSVQVSGNTARATGVTIARHTDRTERNQGTWTLVNEDGGWKISGQNVSNLSTQPA